MLIWARALTLILLGFAALTYGFGWHVWPWLLREGIAQGVIDNTLGALCLKRDRVHPSPDGQRIAVHRYWDCQGATGPGGHLVLIVTPTDTRWLKQEWLFITEEHVLVRSVAWRDERTVVITTDYPLKYGTHYEGKTAYGVRLVHEYEKEFPVPVPTRTPRSTPAPTR